MELAEQIDGYAKGLSSRSQFRALMEHSSRIDDVAVPEDRFRGIANETLIIWGMEDKVIDYTDKYGERLEAALPNAKLQRIADCGHIPQEEKPAETDKLLKNFL